MEQTPEEFITRMSTTNSCTEEDEKVMEYIMNELLKITNTKIVGGMVYVDNMGPMSIHSVCQRILAHMAETK